MTVTLTPETEARLREEADRMGQDATSLVDALLQSALEQASLDYEQTCAAIAEGLADMEAGRTVPLKEARAAWEAQKAGRRQATPAVV